MGVQKQKKKPDIVLTYRKDVSFGFIPCVRFHAKLGAKHGGTEYGRTFWFFNEKKREKFLTQTVPNDLKTQFEANGEGLEVEVKYGVNLKAKATCARIVNTIIMVGVRKRKDKI